MKAAIRSALFGNSHPTDEGFLLFLSEEEFLVACDQIERAHKRELADIEAGAAFLRKDSERLDWLESNPRHAQIIIDGVPTDCVFYGISCAELTRLRDAIDAAMGAQP